MNETPPTFEEVMAALRAGASFQIGGGRCFTTYEMREGALLCIGFDEGDIHESPCTEAQLREAIARDPKAFAAALLAPRKSRP